MTKEEFHKLFDNKELNWKMIFWDKDNLFKVSSYSGETVEKSGRQISGDPVYGYTYGSATITEENCENYHIKLNGPQQAAAYIGEMNAVDDIKRRMY